MVGIPRHEIEESFRMAARREWWLPAELLVGVVAYYVWVVATWAVGADLVGLFGVAVGTDGGTPSGSAVALYATLWLFLPALIGLLRLRGRTLNFRGNLERMYRFERPVSLLVPPAVFLYVAVLGWIVAGAFSWYVYLLLVAATLFAVLRTLAYSYRVFAFSHPLVMHLVAFVTIALQALGGLGIVVGFWGGDASEAQPLVTAIIETLGLGWITGTQTVAGMDTPIAPGLGIAAPIALVGAYLLVQTVAAIMVRVMEPDVTPADIRGGQRYPPAVRTADGAGPSPRSTVYHSPKSPGPAGGSTTSSRSSGSSSPSGRATGSPSDAGGGARSTNGSSASDGASSSSTSDDAGGSDDDADEAVDDVSHTRVFTPPDDAEMGAVAEQSSDGQDACPACGQSFAVDADVKFCPNCGEELS